LVAVVGVVDYVAANRMSDPVAEYHLSARLKEKISQKGSLLMMLTDVCEEMVGLVLMLVVRLL
jgi:hypothetical protein